MRARTKTIEPEVLEVLKNVEIDGNNVRITQQLDRKLYKKTNDALEALGGKWNRKAKAHVFSEDPRQAIAAAVGGGTYESVKDAEKEAGYFPTPVGLAERIVKEADIRPGDRVLEPSAGQGRIADVIRAKHPDADLYLCELLEGNIDALIAKGYPRGRICPDFLRFQPVKKFDRIVMNPPFAKQADVDHVTRAYDMLVPGGKLVSIMSPSWQSRDDKRSKVFRQLVQSASGYVKENPEKSFHESGTDVRTVTVVLTKKGTKIPKPRFKEGDAVVDTAGRSGVVWKTPSEDMFDRDMWTYRVQVMDPETRHKIYWNENTMSLAPKPSRRSSKKDPNPTPVGLAKRVVKLADIQPGDRVLEPSAGQGRIADEIRAQHPDADLYLCELLEGNIDALIAKGYPRGRICPDFLRFQPVQKFDRIVMNPPFAKQADIDHVTRAYGMLAPGGKLVSIMSPGFQFRTDKKATAFRELVKDGSGAVMENPEKAFHESGTDVRTVTIVLTKPGDSDLEREGWRRSPDPMYSKGDRVVNRFIPNKRGVILADADPSQYEVRANAGHRYKVRNIKTGKEEWWYEGLIALESGSRRPATAAAMENVKRSSLWSGLPVKARRNVLRMIEHGGPLYAEFFGSTSEKVQQAAKRRLEKTGWDLSKIQAAIYEGVDAWEWAKHEHKLNILAPDAFAKLTELEGKAWASEEREHADEPGRFLDAQDAYRILKDAGLTQTHTLADVADSPGFVGSDDEIYVVLRDGEIALLEDTATPAKVEKAEQILRVIIPEDPDPFEAKPQSGVRMTSARKAAARKSPKAKSKKPKGAGLDPKFEAALERYVATVQGIINDDFARNYPNLTPPEIRYEKLRKYVRVYRFENGRAASVHSFVDPATGDIYKSASWKTPAKHARGNVYQDPTEALGARGGVVYLR